MKSRVIGVTGGFIMISPILLYWFIHGSYERYIWVINDPYPFSQFGSGPFQMITYITLFVVGLGMVTSSIWFQKHRNIN